MRHHFEGTERRVLFVCSAGLLRSPTAADLGRKMGWNTRSCGTHLWSLIPVNEALLSWAELIVCMEHIHKDAIEGLLKTHHIEYRPVEVLDIRDIYRRNDEELVRILEEKLHALRWPA